MSLLLALAEAGPELPIPLMGERWALNVVPVNGWETHLGTGQANQILTAAGALSKILNASGSATMQLGAVGSGLRVLLGVGSPSNIVLSALGFGEIIAGSISILGSGRADLKLTGAYQIPATFLRAGFVSNKSARTMRVGGDYREFKVQAEQKIRLRPEGIMRVSKDRRH